jgi:hypothetical protein
MKAVFLTILAMLAVVLPSAPTEAQTCQTGVGPAKNAFAAEFCKSASGTSDGTQDGGSSADPAEIWVWKPICNQQNPQVPGGQGLCTNQMQCPRGETLMRRWRIRPLPHLSGDITCMPNAAANRPEITPALVLNAFRRIPLPRLVTHIQPADKTLINFDTIFYTAAHPFGRTVTLLGQRVHLAIRPSSFRWVHGDGTAATTTTGGAPYPAKIVTYRYQHAHTTVRAHVEVTWSARFSVNGSAMRPVPGTVTTVGPATPLRVAEASPALSGAGH